MSLLLQSAQAFKNSISPPPDMLPSDWGQAHYVITKGPASGKTWTPKEGWEFQIGILDGLFGPLKPGEEVRDGVLFKGAKSGMSMIADLGLHYWAGFRRKSAASVSPRKPDSNDRAAESERTIRASKELRRVFQKTKGRTKQALYGAQLIFRSAETDRDLVDWGAMVVAGDEKDRWAQQNFNASSMIEERQGGYHERINVELSTPTVPDYGVHKSFLESDQRYYNVPCPIYGCGFVQVLNFEQNITWDKDLETIEDRADSAKFICQKCGKSWNRAARCRANKRGIWKSTDKTKKKIGYSISRLYVPTALAREFVKKWLEGKTDVGALREFYNQKLGLPFLATIGDLDRAAIERVITNKISWGAPPPGYHRVFAGIDVQGDEDPFEFYWELRAFDESNNCAVFKYGVSRGNDEMASVLNDVYAGFKIERALIDISDGHHRHAVEELCAAVGILEAAKFDWKTQVHFRRFRREQKGQKKTHGIEGWSINRELALDDNMIRFFEQRGREPTIGIAMNPAPGRQKEMKEHYTGLRRSREEGPDGPIYQYKKKRAVGVDYPFAGALAEVARRIGGSTKPGQGSYGPIETIKKHARVKAKEAKVSGGKRVMNSGVRVIGGKNKRRF